MASTFANRDTNWYIRTGGAETNGGGFDSTVTNAGTNYADQDAAQLSLTDLATSGVSANISSATGGFTAAMIGNVLRIASGTNFTADYYVVTAVADTNNATVDRNCATGAGSGGVCKLGGAHVHIKNYASSSGSGSNNPALATPLIGGNTINIRGGGTLDPGSSDYDWSADYWSFPSGGNITGGNPKIVGYNGRPRISHRGILWFTGSYVWVKNLSLFQSNATWTTHTWFDVTTASYYNCIFDTNGIDGQVAQFGNGSNASGAMLCCEIRNTGGGAAASTNFGIAHRHGGGFIYGVWIHGLRSNGIISNGCYGAMHNCLINGNGGDGYKDTETDGSAPIPLVIMNCTFDANGGHGLNFAANGISNHIIANNIISNHVGASKYAVNFADTNKLNTQKYRYLFGYNDYYGNTTNFNTVSSAVTWSINPAVDGPLVGDLTVDPQYANAAGNDFTPGVNVKNLGLFSYALPNTAYKINMGGVFT